jgi:hypothetical protein
MIGIACDWGYDMLVGFYLTTLVLPGEARTLFSERFGKGFDFDGF